LLGHFSIQNKNLNRFNEDVKISSPQILPNDPIKPSSCFPAGVIIIRIRRRYFFSSAIHTTVFFVNSK
jgi:hypothetical protein